MERKCEYCDKIFSGQSLKQLEWYVIMHKLRIHPDKVKIVEHGKNK